jgi:hypothetical protein
MCNKDETFQYDVCKVMLCCLILFVERGEYADCCGSSHIDPTRISLAVHKDIFSFCSFFVSPLGARWL